VGGEDRHEVSVCGVDPATRGLRMNECLTVLRQLLTGTEVTFHGKFFDLDEAVIIPPPAAPIPITVGGRSDAAIRRAGRLGDGWLGIWNSPRRFAAAAEMAAQEAALTGRPDPPARHAMQVWCGLADSREADPGTEIRDAARLELARLGTGRCMVSIDCRDEELSIEVVDDGRGGSIAGIGYGIAGMRERVSLLHGHFTAGPRPEGGFRVAARLPVPVPAGVR
jgi:alkanesulfonate monooxygenase SsuD/methylene tetrahydromethanopterin reductase-like flavin-dependent oxidoreductase (luciferase family)